MAVRARLVAPRTVRTDWPWHEAETKALPVSLMLHGDRRFEAENFLAGGFATRIAIEAKSTGWVYLREIAEPWQPSRLKGIQVSPDFGTPFLTATQTLDIRPTPRKWLSLDRTDSSAQRFVEPGTILVTCSGNVGRATLARESLKDILISHDILRVSLNSDARWGWVYAYLRAPSVRKMMTSAQYGHIIKHLEVSHLGALPVIEISDDLLTHFQKKVQTLLEKRNKSHELLLLAEAKFSEAVRADDALEEDEGTGFTLSASGFQDRRRRLEASFHSPTVSNILRRFSSQGHKTEALSDLTDGVWWISRFKRIFGEAGAPYMSADELFSLNPIITKRVLIEQAANADQYFAKAGWLMMACSGQVYGTLGSVALITETDEDKFFSHDLIRIVPKTNLIRPGYLYTALSHPDLGRPLVLRYAYGTSIPHLEPADIATFPVVRLSNSIEEKIADCAEEAVSLRREADELENNIAMEADDILQSFIAS